MSPSFKHGMLMLILYRYCILYNKLNIVKNCGLRKIRAKKIISQVELSVCYKIEFFSIYDRLYIPVQFNAFSDWRMGESRIVSMTLVVLPKKQK